jgi:anti-sigma factor RsiW
VGVHRLDEDPGEGADDAALTRFLLGELPDQERLRLEDACFEDEALFARLLRAEDDLIDAYVRGQLTAAERERFERRFGQTRAQARRVRFARLLRHAAEERRGTDAGQWPRWAAPAAAVVLATVLGAWWLIGRGTKPPVARAPVEGTTTPAPRLGPSPSPVPAEAGPVRERPVAPVAVASLTLSPGMIRAGGETPKVVLRTAIEEVELRLELGPGLPAGAYSGYRALVQTAAGAEVWRGGGLRASGIAARPFIGVRLPARTLTSGDYVVLLSGRNAEGREDDLRGYAFRVSR